MINEQRPSAVMMMRILFSKTGYAKYISHLDLQRAMMRLLRRADIPIWLTQGFNPHPYLNFCSPLSVGTEGERELLDVKLAEIMPFDEIKTRLAANLPQGFAVEKVYEADRDFAQAVSAAYKVRLAVSRKELDAFLAQETIPVIKKTKSSERTLDLKLFADFGDAVGTDGDLTVTVMLPCGNDLNINPMLFAAACGEYVGRPEPALKIVRTGFYDTNGNLFA